MFKALFYPRQVKFYTDNVRATVTNSMSVWEGVSLPCSLTHVTCAVLCWKIRNMIGLDEIN